MKKICAIFALISALFLASCGGTSIKELTSPLTDSFSAVFSVSSDGKDLGELALVKDGYTFTFIFDEKYTFVYNGGKWNVSYSGLSVPLSPGAAKRSTPNMLVEAISAPSDFKWKITEEDGGSVFRCERQDADVVLIIDKTSSKPAKIIYKTTEFDVVKFDPAV